MRYAVPVRSGADKLDRQFAKLASGIPADRLRQILHEGGEIIAEEQRRLVPVRTGRLQRSIAVTDEHDTRIYGTLGRRIDDGAKLVYIGPVGSEENGDVYYAKFIEFGTSYFGPQPFVRPALRSKRYRTEKLIRVRIAAEIEKLAR